MQVIFRPKDLEQLFGMYDRQRNHWKENGHLVPFFTMGKNKAGRYSLLNLVKLKTQKALRAKGITLHQTKKVIENLEEALNDAKEDGIPLLACHIYIKDHDFPHGRTKQRRVYISTGEFLPNPHLEALLTHVSIPELRRDIANLYPKSENKDSPEFYDRPRKRRRHSHRLYTPTQVLKKTSLPQHTLIRLHKKGLAAASYKTKKGETEQFEHSYTDRVPRTRHYSFEDIIILETARQLQLQHFSQQRMKTQDTIPKVKELLRKGNQPLHHYHLFLQGQHMLASTDYLRFPPDERWLEVDLTELRP